MKALVFGSLNIDYVYQVPHFVQAGETLSSSGYERFCGGKGLNQAIALAKAGMKTYMAGSIGPEGVFLLDELQRAGVDTSCVIQGPIPTGHALIQRDKSGDNAILLFGGANRTITEKQEESALAFFQEGDLLLVQNEINALPILLQAANRKGMHIALNPSPMELPQILNLVPFAEFLLLNRVEASQLLQNDHADDLTLIRELLALWPDKKIILTLGSEGAIFASRNALIRQEAFPVATVDTTGAGDTFTGYFLASYLRNADPAAALKDACMSAAIAVSRKGAAPAIPEREEVEQFLRT